MTRLGRGLFREAASVTHRCSSRCRRWVDEAIADRLRVFEPLRAIPPPRCGKPRNGRDFVSEAWRRHRVRLESCPRKKRRGSVRSYTRHSIWTTS